MIGLAPARLEHAHQGFVGVQYRQWQQCVAHPINPRLQRYPAGADPPGQGRAGNRDAVVGVGADRPSCQYSGR